MVAARTAHAGATVRSLGSSTPLYLLFVGLPVWWALGGAYFVWPLLTFPLLLPMLMRGNIRIPPRFGLWLLFLGWICLASLQLEDAIDFGLFGWRASLYLSATILFLYVYNSSRKRLPDGIVVKVLALFWGAVVIGGFAGVLLPYASFSTPVEALMPASFLQDKTAYYFVHPALSEVMTFLGYPVGRPKTLFAFSNQWGATVAVLTPFAFAALSQTRPRSGPRRLLIGLLVLSVVPITVSLNRGLWLSLGIGLLFIVFRLARRGDLRALRVAAVSALVIAGIIFLSPLGGLVNDRFTSESNSNNTRSTVYQATLAQVAQSPLIGFGSPAGAQFDANLPNLGTQGQLFTIIYSYGVPALLFFAGWFLYAFMRSLPRRGSPVRFWANASLLILLVELPYYNYMPATLHVAMVAAALVWRDVTGPSADPPARPVPTRRLSISPSRA